MKVETIILTGIIFSSFLGALISLMIAFTGDELRQIVNWLLGSVSMRGWSYVKIILPFFILGSFCYDEWKRIERHVFRRGPGPHLGVDVKRRKLMVLDGRFRF